MARKKKSKLEKDFLGEFKAAVETLYPESLWYKIPDHPSIKQLKFIPEKPFDAFWLVNGHFFVFEAKVHKVHTAFSFSRVTTGQLENLTLAKRNGAEAYLLINERHGLGNARVNRVLVVAPETFNLISRNRKSIKMFELERFSDYVLDYSKSGKSWPAGALL